MIATTVLPFGPPVRRGSPEGRRDFHSLEEELTVIGELRAVQQARSAYRARLGQVSREPTGSKLRDADVPSFPADPNIERRRLTREASIGMTRRQTREGSLQ